MNEALIAVFNIIKPFVSFFETILKGFYRDDLTVFGHPLYSWFIGIFIISALLSIVTGIWED